jgi:hypothetical protein
VDGSSSLWDGTSWGSCGGAGSWGVCSGTAGSVAVGGGGGAIGQPFSHRNPVYKNPGSGPDISRNKQSIKSRNIFIDLVPACKTRIFRVEKLPLIQSHLSVLSLYYSSWLLFSIFGRYFLWPILDPESRSDFGSPICTSDTVLILKF